MYALEVLTFFNCFNWRILICHTKDNFTLSNRIRTFKGLYIILYITIEVIFHWVRFQVSLVNIDFKNLSFCKNILPVKM